MTNVYIKRTYNGGATDVPTIVKVEYVLSSITNQIKVVDMWVDGKYHRLNWMSWKTIIYLITLPSERRLDK